MKINFNTTTKKVFTFGLIVELLLFLVLLLSVKCDDGNPVKSTLSPVGKWALEETGETFDKTMIIDIKPDETYTITGSLSDNTVSWTVITEKGVWEQRKNKLILNPNECQKLNLELGVLENCDCFGAATYILNDATITDGDITLKRM